VIPMSDDPRVSADPASPAPTGGRKPWHTPSLEEIDYSETQATPNPGPIYDAPVYSS
jgi:hypothetical protein